MFMCALYSKRLILYGLGEFVYRFRCRLGGGAGGNRKSNIL